MVLQKESGCNEIELCILLFIHWSLLKKIGSIINKICIKIFLCPKFFTGLFINNIPLICTSDKKMMEFNIVIVRLLL